MTPTVARPRILIAEDEDELRQALADMLTTHGYRVVGLASDGAEAVGIAQGTTIDLALLDYRMPGIDGLTAAELIRAISPNVQFVMFTAYDDQALSLDAARAGAFAFLVKGCPPSLILQALDAAMAKGYELERAAGRQASSIRRSDAESIPHAS
jgi:two-component system, response regulator PdtaR